MATGYFSPTLLSNETVETFLVSDMETDMGLTQSPYTLMTPPAGTTWQTAAPIITGARMHGDGLPAWWLSGLDVSNQAKIDAKAWLIANWWNAITPWVVIYPSSTNLCTNAAVRVTNVQVYILSIASGAWSRLYYNDQYPNSLDWWDLSVATNRGAVDRTYVNDQIPAYTSVYLAADRTAVDVGPTTAKYKKVHNGFGKYTVNGSDVGGVMVTCKSQLVAINNGGAFNATPEFLLSIGADGYPNTTDNLGAGQLVGATYVPGIGGSRFSLVPQNGTQKRHFFITYKGANTTIDNSSAYVAAHPTYAGMILTHAQLTANPPTFAQQQHT